MDRLYLLGSLPPPTGGVTVFVERRLARLRREGRAVSLRDWNRMGAIRRALWILSILADPRRADFELNGLETVPMTALAVRPFPARIVYWVHSGRFVGGLGSVRRRVLAAFLRRCDETRFAGEHVWSAFEEAGLPRARSSCFANAFLAPDLDTEGALLARFHPRTLEFVSDHHPLLVMQGSEGWYRGVDLYGTDLALRALPRLAVAHPRIGLVVGRPSSVSEAYRAAVSPLEDELAAAGLAGAVHWLEGEQPLWPLIRRASVFLRPTADDGDSISVREALSFGVPVAASDACPRPEGTALFCSRDAGDLARVVADLLGTRP